MTRPAAGRSVDALLALGVVLSVAVTPVLCKTLMLRPSAGVAVAGAALIGGRAWRGIFLGSLLSDVAWALLSGMPSLFPVNLLAALAAAAGTAVATALSGHALGRALGDRDPFARPLDALRFFAFGPGIYALLSAAAGAATRRLGGPLAIADWFAADLLGAIIVAPPMLLWRHWRGAAVGPAGSGETIAVAAASLAATVLVSGPWRGWLGPAPFLDTLFVVPLLWAAARCDQRLSASLGAVCLFMIGLGAEQGYGPYARPPGGASGVIAPAAVLAVLGAVLVVAGALHDARERALGVLREAERRAGAEALRRADASYRTLVDGAPFGVFRATLDGRLLSVNPALVAMLGCTSGDDLLGPPGPDARGVPEMEPRLIERLAATGVLEAAEVEWKRKDGTPIAVRLNGRALPHAAGGAEGIEVIAEDITGRRRLEQELGQAQRMEAIGQLAGGVAHDFNNLLTVIIGRSAMTLWRMGPDDPQRQDIELIRTAASRATDVTRQLLAFSRKQEIQPTVLDLNAIVIEVESLLCRVLGEDIELTTVLSPALWPIRADPSQIEQVIMNLAVNARDAMPHGGRLTIETANVEPGEAHEAGPSPAHPQRYVRLAIADTGVGMDAETQAKIFEPFFTTKEPGKGTGLGLAIVYDVVRQGGGHIRVESAPGRGTRFEIYLPRVDAGPEGPGRAAAPADPPRGSEVVLVAEDDPPLRQMVGEALASWGYTVLEAKDARDAVTLSEQYAGRGIDLLVTDVVMPQQSGRAVAASLQSRRPDLRVLYMSGYAEGTVLGEGLVGRQSDFLRKPFTLDALARKVREVLGPATSDRP